MDYSHCTSPGNSCRFCPLLEIKEIPLRAFSVRQSAWTKAIGPFSPLPQQPQPSNSHQRSSIMPFTNTRTEDRGQQADRLISLTASSQLFHHLVTTMRAPHVLKAHIHVQGFIWACAALGISLLIPPPPNMHTHTL